MEGPLFQSIACVVSDFAFLFSRVKKYLAFRQLDKRNDALNAWGLLFFAHRNERRLEWVVFHLSTKRTPISMLFRAYTRLVFC